MVNMIDIEDIKPEDITLELIKNLRKINSFESNKLQKL